jgi:hypothetical protein
MCNTACQIIPQQKDVSKSQHGTNPSVSHNMEQTCQSVTIRNKPVSLSQHGTNPSVCHNMEHTRQSVTIWNKPISPVRTSLLSHSSQRPPPFHMHNSVPVVFLTTPPYPLTPSAHSITRCSSFAYGLCPLRTPWPVANWV